MGKLLSWVVIGLLGWVAWKMFVIGKRKAERAREEAAAARREGEPADARGRPAAGGDAAGAGRKALHGELMVRCEHCGVHLPASEAVSAEGRSYCSVEHRDADRARQKSA